jgi:hypothetical protein
MLRVACFAASQSQKTERSAHYGVLTLAAYSTRQTQDLSAEQDIEKSIMEEWMAMVRLAWIASELGSATGFPKETGIPQKSPPDEDPECWRDAAYSIRHTPRRYSPDG